MRTRPIDEQRPTLRALARGHNALHQCLDDTRADVAQIKLTVAETKAKVETIEAGLGLAGGRKKVAGLASGWQAFGRTFAATTSAIVSAAIAYKLVVLLLPAAWLAAQALSRAALKGVF